MNNLDHPKNRILTLARNPQILTFCLATATVLFSLSVHEAWQDEAEAPARIYRFGWNIWALMESFRGDGHFPLYHIVLYPFFNIGHRVCGIDATLIIKTVTFLQYSILAYLTVKWIKFPFSALFLFSYYVLFEYGTISRCYLLALILLFIIFRGTLFLKQRNKAVDTLVCFLFPLTHVLSTIYAGPLLVYSMIKRDWTRVAAFAASFPIAIYYLKAHSATSYSYLSTEQRTLTDYVQAIVSSIVSAWIPFSTEQGWWNRSFAEHFQGPVIVLTLFLVGLVALAIATLYRYDPLLTAACCVGSFLGIVVLVVKYPLGTFRHDGYAAWTFLCLLVLLLSLPKSAQTAPQFYTDSASSKIPLPLRKLVQSSLVYSCVSILALHSFFGLAAVYKDINGIFAFPQKQIQVLKKLTEDSPNITLFDYPSGSSLSITTFSNWKYEIYPIRSLADRNCTKSSNAENSTLVPEASSCPAEIGITTWAFPLQGLSEGKFYLGSGDQAFQDSLAEKFFDQSVGSFLTERAFLCEQVAAFQGSQTVDEYTYKCFRRKG